MNHLIVMVTSSPRLSSDYLQDLVQFTGRDLVDKCHGVSRRFSRVLSATAEVHLPRRVFMMQIESVVRGLFQTSAVTYR